MGGNPSATTAHGSVLRHGAACGLLTHVRHVSSVARL